MSFIHIQTFCHATEDLNKVLKAIQQILPEKYVKEVSFNKKKLKGHYGNPIILIETKIKRKEVIFAFAKKLLSSHNNGKSPIHQAYVTNPKNQNIYIRLNKQRAFQGFIEICARDPIRIHLKLKNRIVNPSRTGKKK